MGLVDWQFEVELPFEQDGGWWFAVHGCKSWRWGPFADVSSADDASMRVFRRWNDAARDRGGWAWKSTSRRWVVTAPEGTVVHGRPLERAPCTVHHQKS